MKREKIKRLIDAEEMKRHKVKTAVYFIIRAVTAGVMVVSILQGKWENTMTCVLTLLLMLIPVFVERRLRIALPTVMECVVIIFMFAANILGEIHSFYGKIPMWDTILHTLNGFICAGVGFGLIDILNRHERVKMQLSPVFVVLFSFCFSMTVGTVWEFFEFGMDVFFANDMQKDTVINSIHSYTLLDSLGTMNAENIKETAVNGQSLGINGYLDVGLYDTMKDLFVNFVGAVVFNIAGYFYLIGRKKHTEFIENFIPTAIKETVPGTKV